MLKENSPHLTTIHQWKRYVYVWAYLFLFLFALSLPFSFSFFPKIGIHLSYHTQSFYTWIADTYLHTETVHDPATSDSVLHYIHTFFLLIFSFIFSIIGIRFLRSETVEKGIFFFQFIIRWIVIFFLLQYGLDKLFLIQFYPPAPNTLYTPIGYASKDLLFWSTMGTSKSYNYFMALMELLPAVLLMFQKTRFIGTFISVGVFLNILALNIGFNITVKLLSFYLLICSLTLITHHSSLLLTFFNGSQPKRIVPVTSVSNKSTWSFILPILLIGIELIPRYTHHSTNSHQRTLSDTYTVTDHTGTSNIVDLTTLKRIHFHPNNYLIFESNETLFTSFQFHRSKHPMTFKIDQFPSTLTLNNDSSTIEINWLEAGIPISLSLKKNNNLQLPAMQDHIHWTAEGRINDFN